MTAVQARLRAAAPLLLLAPPLGLALLPGELGTLGARAALVAAALLAVALLVRRRSPPPLARLTVAERIALGRDQALALVEVDGRSFLVGVGRDSVRLLAELKSDEGGRP